MAASCSLQCQTQQLIGTHLHLHAWDPLTGSEASARLQMTCRRKTRATSCRAEYLGAPASVATSNAAYSTSML